MHENIIHPDSHSKLLLATKEYFLFEDQSKLRVYKGIPILFSKESIFTEEDIFTDKITTQNSVHLDTNNLKNFIRRRILPSLCKDYNIEKRYDALSKLLPNKSNVLIIGAGEKIQYYKNKFPHCKVTTSDVHCQFKPDYVFDGHFIPFADNSFDLVLAAQVIEHTINPWKFCLELQRITRIDGLLQIEAPQNFPYHAEPFDFFRFTYTGLRSLFPQCEVVYSEITEGNASMVAVTISNYMVNLSSKRLVRSCWLLITRLFLGWIKYLDKLNPDINRRTVSMPKGYAFTFKKDKKIRKSVDLLSDFYKLKK